MQKPFLFFFRQNLRVCLVGIFVLALTSILDALTPLFLKFIIDEITLKEKGSSAQLYLFIFLLGCSLSILALCRFGWGFCLARLTSSVYMQLQQKVFLSLTKVGMYFFHKNRMGHVLNMLTNDIAHFCGAMGKGNLFALDVLFTLSAVIPIMFYISPQWTWKCLLLFPFVLFFHGFIARKLAKRFQREQKHLSRLSSHVTESIYGIRTVKALAKEKFQLKSFEKQNKNYERACNHTLIMDSLLGVFSFSATGIITLILLWFGSKDVMNGIVTIGSLVAFQRYVHRLEWPIMASSLILSLYKKGRISFSRLNSVLEKKPDPIYKGRIKVSGFHSLKVKDLSFSYPENQRPLLRHISFELKEGEKLALIGDNGSGKSTLLHLLARIWPANNKTLFMNDIPFEKIEASSFYKSLTFLTQRPFLFNDSIFNNITLGGKTLSPTTIKHLIQKTLLEQDIQKFPEHMKTLVGEEGLYLSSGQKQRIALARGLYADTPLLLCDTPLSHVDYDTAHTIYENFLSQGDKSMVFILNNPLQLPYFDKVLVLKEGEVEFFGTLIEADKQSTTYHRFCKNLETFKAVTPATETATAITES